MTPQEIDILESDDAAVCFNLGVKSMENGEYAKAEIFFLRTRFLAPDSQETSLNLGYVLDQQGRAAEALACYESILAVAPENHKARYNRAAHLLRAGDLVNGFADYEARFSAITSADPRNYSQPRWDGSPLEGRSILVYCEQGLGDAIQFARYIPLLVDKGGRVILEAQQSLISLLASLNSVEKVLLKSETPPLTNFHIPLLSLPHLFGTTLSTVPTDIPYLSPPLDLVRYWQAKLGESQSVFRIGLAWAGKATPDPNRSCPPDHLAPLLDIPSTCFYSLQFGESDRLPLSSKMAGHVIDLADDLGDFAKTAALIANLDLIITIDTVVAHLAGALGKPVWVMLPFASDWRWMSDRADSPWYPSMRLFRQPRPGDWQPVVLEIAQTLREQLAPQKHESAVFSDMLEVSLQKGLLSLENKDPDAAIAELCNLLLHLPNDSAVWFNLGRAYGMKGQMTEAVNAYRRALSDNSGSPAIWFALGEILLKQKAYPEAEVCLRKAHGLKPDSVEILMNLGNAFAAQCKTVEACDTCKKILAIRPGYVEVIYNLASLQLRSGDYRLGFANFEARLAIEKFDIDSRRYSQSRWDGSPLNGKSILIYGEQGMGDVIQFARYIPFVAERGGKVVLEVDPPLIPLFESFPGVDRLIPKSKEPPLTDVYIQLLSLPYLFGTTLETVPDQVPYIFPDQAKVEQWRQCLASQGSAFRVGLVWRGNPKNPRDEVRSCALSRFAPLAGLPDVMFYSLQVGSAEAEAASAPEGMNLADYSSLLTDLTETAALISNLDLVISVDTAVAHLAGAMGQQVWVLLPEGSEWRWLEGHSDTPWYPTMRVFEHKTDSDWEGMIHLVRIALEKLLSETTIRDDIEFRYTYGVSLKEAGNLKDAESCFRQIVEQHQELPDPQHSLGVVLQLQGRTQEAISHYRSAINLDPDFAKAHYNLANAQLSCGQYQEALVSVRNVLQCDPQHADAHWLLGMLLLRSGDFLNGWREYEWRWKAEGFTSTIPELGRPLWDGSPFENKTLLIHMEQGRGDMIQFIRYAPLALALGGRVIICSLPELVSLLSTVEGVSQVVDRNKPLPDFDLHIPVQSLPRALKTTLETIPCRMPYLWPNPIKMEKWRLLLTAEKRLRIGLAWQGSPVHIDDRNRSCSLTELRPLLDLKGVAFYSLQIGSGCEQLAECSDDISITDLTSDIQDFSDTAAFVANLDLVICVDTAVAHLAGALGKQVWLMLPYVAEWRWLSEREDSPWYPTMRLFRQPSPGDWKMVVGMVRQELVFLLKDTTFHTQRGIDRLKLGHAAEAESAFTMAVALNPDNAEAHCNLGVALDAQHRYEEAIDFYRAALLYEPDFLQALFNMGNAYISLFKPSEARTCYEKCVELKPDFVSAYICLGEIEKQQLAFDQACAYFENALSLDPGCADAWQGVAEVQQAQEKFEQAIVAYKKVLSLDAGRTSTWNLLGTVFQSLEKLDEAETCYRQALKLLPDSLTILNNLGVVLNAQGRLEEAIAIYYHLLKIDNSYAEGHWNLSVALLAAGKYLEGWQEYEWRFRKTNPVVLRDFPQPLWDGSDLQGKTILLHAEQGFGDTFQFARYAPLVARRGGIVIIECQVPALKRLLNSLVGVDKIVVSGEDLPPFDCHLPMMSLPLLFGTTLETIPIPIPYLAAEPTDVKAWQQRLSTSSSFRVGLVWFAKQSQVLNRKRSCRLEMFAPLWSVPGVEFFSLQIGLGTEQISECVPAPPVKDLTAQITDFADTAAFIANLDLVITIDTAVAHLAGALGAKTWTILPYVAEWRWLCQRHDSPWYPTMRLFRQPAAGDWPALMTTVAGALNECVQSEMEEKNGLLSHQSRLRVGLAWSGRQDNPFNRKRTCPFAMLAPLLDLPGIQFVSLQMDCQEEGVEGLVDLTHEIRNFEDTAALMANLDLIISIDTSVVHLAAAMGRPTWVLLSHVADWRWLNDRADSPWYPTVELFRQPDHGDWETVVNEVAHRLDQLNGKQLQKPQVKRSSCYSHERLLLEQLLEDHQQMVQQNLLSPDAHLDLGATQALLGNEQEAAASFRRVLELDPEHVAAHLNLAYALLALGDYNQGWRHFEWRLHRITPGQIPPWPMLQPNTIGTHLAGSTVLVHCEQGFGDTIQFARFLPLLAQAGYRVIVSCQVPVASLMASINGVSLVVAHGEPLPVCQIQVLLLSLPYLFSTTLETVPNLTPYFVPHTRQIDGWRARLNNFKTGT